MHPILAQLGTIPRQAPNMPSFDTSYINNQGQRTFVPQGADLAQILMGLSPAAQRLNLNTAGGGTIRTNLADQGRIRSSKWAVPWWNLMDQGGIMGTQSRSY